MGSCWNIAAIYIAIFRTLLLDYLIRNELFSKLKINFIKV